MMGRRLPALPGKTKEVTEPLTKTSVSQASSRPPRVRVSSWELREPIAAKRIANRLHRRTSD
jgi:hypothetical protein